jgi:tetraacyldisaccharide 4'-kinase
MTTPKKSPVPVICVGNLVAGGAGKTPVALSLGGRLRGRGMTVHFLARGYGGRAAGPLRVDPDSHAASEVGDEALLLARIAPTWIARDRTGAIAAAAKGAQAIVMDDGFQDPAVDKDFSIVVVDGAFGFGNACVIPAGPLREPIARGLARADALAVIGADAWGVAAHPDVRSSGLPILAAAVEPGPGASRLRGRPVVAFAGIGVPGKFFTLLENCGCRVVGTHAFPDHHPYAAAEIASLKSEAAGKTATLVTTEKDFVRLPHSLREGIRAVPIALKWSDEAALDVMLRPVLDNRV